MAFTHSVSISEGCWRRHCSAMFTASALARATRSGERRSRWQPALPEIPKTAVMSAMLRPRSSCAAMIATRLAATVSGFLDLDWISATVTLALSATSWSNPLSSPAHRGLIGVPWRMTGFCTRAEAAWSRVDEVASTGAPWLVRSSARRAFAPSPLRSGSRAPPLLDTTKS